ncbi:uncharacterized protein LOC133784912 [Humulus lupulus]|uniref:uncharacterized protein LOC133784912 n=1 Tax=Humulus lupulus TaxID=3486 RepID=UPI002B4091F0|nr:uncharacterized protein LOC133784912 [Humulus lupulus]
MVCVVLRANPPFFVFEGFIKCLWGKLGIEKVARMNAGYTIVKFCDVTTRDMVLESGVVHFDRKPVLLRPWSTDLDTLRLVKSVSVWIRLPDLGLQYLGTKCLSALVSTIGKPMMIDKVTKERSMVKFVRVLVDVEISNHIPQFISFLNERGQLMDCKRDQGAIWRKKETKPGLENVEANQATTAPVSKILPKVPQDLVTGIDTQTGMLKEKCSSKSGLEIKWTTLKKVGGAKHILSDTQNLRTNKYNVLQENQMVVIKKGQQEINDSNGRVQRAFLETKLRGNKIEEMMQSVFEDEQFVHYCVKIKGVTQKFCLTFIYGRNSVEERKSLWTQLYLLEFLVHPWLVVGDCNAVFDNDDRIGGRPATELELEDGRHWRVCTMVDELRSIGSHYTWSNKQVEGARIFSKLDRVFKNEAWVDAFPDSEARFNWDVISNHCYCIIKIVPDLILGVRPFKDFNMWADHEDFRSTVLRSWSDLIETYGLQRILKKLHRLKSILLQFNKVKLVM